MTPAETINTVNRMLAWLDDLKRDHPGAVVRAVATWGSWNMKAFTLKDPSKPKPIPRTTSIAEMEESLRSILNDLERLKAEHPDATVCTRVKNRRPQFGAILSATMTGSERIVTNAPRS